MTTSLASGPGRGDVPELPSVPVHRKGVRGDVKVSPLWTFRPFCLRVQSCCSSREASAVLSHVWGRSEGGCGQESQVQEGRAAGVDPPSATTERAHLPQPPQRGPISVSPTEGNGAGQPGSEQGSQPHTQPGDPSLFTLDPAPHPHLSSGSQLQGTTLAECSRA